MRGIIRRFPAYEVDDYGAVFHIKTGRQLPQYESNKGHSFVVLKVGDRWVSQWVHRLVAQCFVINPRPDAFFDVDHIDQDPHNNHHSNLRYLTRQLNALNSSSLGCHFNKRNKRWEARLFEDRTSRFLGGFKTFLEGHRVYKAARTALVNRIYTNMVSEGPHTPEFLS